MSVKNCVLEGSKLDFRGLRARFWSPPGSILEAPDSIFEGSGRRRRCLRAFSGWQTLGPRLVLHHWAVASEKWSRSCRATRRLPRMPLLPCPGSDGRESTEWVAGGVPPRGLSIRRPPNVRQRRAELISNWLCPISAGQSRYSFAQFDLKCSFPYPFLSPPAWGSPEPSLKKLLSVSCWPILVDFFAFPTALEK